MRRKAKIFNGLDALTNFNELRITRWDDFSTFRDFQNSTHCAKVQTDFLHFNLDLHIFILFLMNPKWYKNKNKIKNCKIDISKVFKKDIKKKIFWSLYLLEN